MGALVGRDSAAAASGQLRVIRAQDLIDEGVEPKASVRAAKKVTQRVVAEKLDRHFGNRGAADITHSLRSLDQRPFLN
jgi:hypothetical protein